MTVVNGLEVVARASACAVVARLGTHLYKGHSREPDTARDLGRCGRI